jgi:hypothetical protein
MKQKPNQPTGDESATPLNRGLKPGMVRVRALTHIAEERPDGSVGRYAPKEEFEVSAERLDAIRGLVESI